MSKSDRIMAWITATVACFVLLFVAYSIGNDQGWAEGYNLAKWEQMQNRGHR